MKEVATISGRTHCRHKAHTVNKQKVISCEVVKYPFPSLVPRGSSPCRKTGEEPGYEARERVLSVFLHGEEPGYEATLSQYVLQKITSQRSRSQVLTICSMHCEQHKSRWGSGKRLSIATISCLLFMN